LFTHEEAVPLCRGGAICNFGVTPLESMAYRTTTPPVQRAIHTMTIAAGIVSALVALVLVAL